MDKRINFKQKVLAFLGKNGWGKCAGISISRFGDEISIHPLTSKGVPARCYIEIPQEDLPEVIAALQKLV